MREQISGAELRKPSDPPADAPITRKIAAGASQYDTIMATFSGNDELDVMARGNLLLLAGRADEARALFEGFLKTADASQKLKFQEGVARAIRAQDGTIGRANGYLVSTVDPEFRSVDAIKSR
jgi:hypothetical protein